MWTSLRVHSERISPVDFKADFSDLCRSMQGKSIIGRADADNAKNSWQTSLLGFWGDVNDRSRSCIFWAIQ